MIVTTANPPLLRWSGDEVSRGHAVSRVTVWRGQVSRNHNKHFTLARSPADTQQNIIGIWESVEDCSIQLTIRSVDISIDASYLCKYILHEQLCSYALLHRRIWQETPLNLSICRIWVDSRYISLMSTSRYVSLLSMSRHVDISRCWVATLQLSADQWVVSGWCSPECEYLDNECGHCGHARHGDMGQAGSWWPVSPSSRTISPPLITPATIHLTAPSHGHCHHYHFSSHLIGGNSESDEYTQSSNGFESGLNE